MKDAIDPGTLDLEYILIKNRKIYLAARYSRNEEMLAYAKDLEGLGYYITSRWVYGEHNITDAQLTNDGDPKDESLRARFAQEDIDDLLAAQTIICFTEAPRTGATRGGRHVEFGVALATHKHCWVVGHRENIFYCLPQVRFFPDWETCLAAAGAP
jgi:hypothetical protein